MGSPNLLSHTEGMIDFYNCQFHVQLSSIDHLDRSVTVGLEQHPGPGHESGYVCIESILRLIPNLPSSMMLCPDEMKVTSGLKNNETTPGKSSQETSTSDLATS
jgi:hypothetical protein